MIERNEEIQKRLISSGLCPSWIIKNVPLHLMVLIPIPVNLNILNNFEYMYILSDIYDPLSRFLENLKKV